MTDLRLTCRTNIISARPSVTERLCLTSRVGYSENNEIILCSVVTRLTWRSWSKRSSEFLSTLFKPPPLSISFLAVIPERIKISLVGLCRLWTGSRLTHMGHFVRAPTWLVRVVSVKTLMAGGLGVTSETLTPPPSFKLSFGGL